MEPKDLSLRQLRTELKRLNESPSGLKDVLIARLKEALERDGKETIPLANLKKKTKEVATAKRFVSIKEKYRRKTVWHHAIIPESPAVSEIEHIHSTHIAEAEPNVILSEDNSRHQENINKLIEEDSFPKEDSSISLNNMEIVSEKRKFNRPFEIESRKRKVFRRRRDDYFEDDVSSSKYSRTMKNEFFEQAQAELQRIKIQRRHDQELAALEQEVENLKKDLLERDSLIAKLHRNIIQMEKDIRNLQLTPVPKELVDNWSAFESLLELGSI